MMVNPSQQIRDLDWKAVGLASLGIATGFAFYFLYRQGKEIISLKGKLFHLENEAARSLNERAQTREKLGDLEQRVQDLERIQNQLREGQGQLQQSYRGLGRELQLQQQGLDELNQRINRGESFVHQMSRRVGALSTNLTELTVDQEEIRTRLDAQQTAAENQIRVTSHLESGQSITPPYSINLGSLMWRLPIGVQQTGSRMSSSNTIPFSLRGIPFQQTGSRVSNSNTIFDSSRNNPSVDLNTRQGNSEPVDPILNMIASLSSNLANIARYVPK